MIEGVLARTKVAREMLANCWVPWSTDDGEGGHCQIGCLIRAFNWGTGYATASRAVREAAFRLHQDLAGARRPRPDCSCPDDFNSDPAIFVNNQLGKEAILAVYDEAILQLEVAALREEEANRVDSEKEEVLS